MSKKRYFILMILAGVLQGCHHRVEPGYPPHVNGWRTYEEHGITLRGSFVLHKGESTDNGQIRIEVLDILPPDSVIDQNDFRAQPMVTFRFTSMSDQKVLCSMTFPENGGFHLCSDLSDFGLSGAGVGGINLKEEWAFFWIH